jgi:hypothetical protein
MARRAKKIVAGGYAIGDVVGGVLVVEVLESAPDGARRYRVRKADLTQMFQLHEYRAIERFADRDWGEALYLRVSEQEMQCLHILRGKNLRGKKSKTESVI